MNRLTWYVGVTATRDSVATITRILAERGIEGATITRALGLWRGALESSLRIETLSDSPEPGDDSATVAANLRESFAQESVLATVESVSAEFVGAAPDLPQAENIRHEFKPTRSH